MNETPSYSVGQSSDAEFDLVPPDAASLIESLRSFGYELQTALADLVDNSLTAEATKIWIDFHWDGGNSVIAVTDDGTGMTEAGLVAAMRAGSRNPLEPRSPRDLGRFGLGLKTASFSQCRRLTVRSKTRSGGLTTRCWDLDHIARVRDWQLLRNADAAAERHFSRQAALQHGTTVLWQRMDRLVADQTTDSDRHQQKFLKRAVAVRSHLGMVFHQIISGTHPAAILLNDRAIDSWDPFLAAEPATQRLPVSRLPLRGATVLVEPFILPHHSKISKATRTAAAGPSGWNAHQGFFVYRNRRLLVPGDWLGFGWRKEEHYKLARIKVEVPNALDQDWQIDVTKSKACPPSALQDELRRIGERTREIAKMVYTHRGARLTPQSDAGRILLWEPKARHDLTFYRLNRDHPLLRHALGSSNDPSAFRALLRLIEETIPLPHITIQNTEHPDRLPAPFEQSAEAQVREVMEEAFQSLTATGYGPKEAGDRLRTIWPFELFPKLLENLQESHAGT